MLTEFIYQWNPFNVCGIEIGVDDLICNPLQPSETLMQDSYGRCRRIRVPTHHSSLWEKAVYWLQVHLNEKGHLDAIDKIISLFYQKLLQSPPQKTEGMQEFNLQIDQLRFLKNDYAFTHFKEQDSSFIDSRLKEIEQHVYSIFSYYHKQQVHEQEELRRKNFNIFQEQLNQKLHELSIEYLSGLLAARLLAIAPSDMVKKLFEERVQSLDFRLQIVQSLHDQINEMEKEHEGKFTIPNLGEVLSRIRAKLTHEVRNINVEAEILIGNLIMNYRLAFSKQEVKKILDSIEVDPEEFREGKMCAFLFEETLNSEIQRIQSIFGKKFARIRENNDKNPAI